MNLITLPKTRPSAMETALYQKHIRWFHAQYQQLDQFLQLSAPAPGTVPVTRESASEVTATPRLVFLGVPGSGVSVEYSREKLLTQFRSEATTYPAKILADRERLVTNQLVARQTGWFWRKEQQVLELMATATADPQSQSQSKPASRYLVVRVTANLNTVYECLAQGIVANKLIAGLLGVSKSPARRYKLGLYNRFLLAILPGLLNASTESNPNSTATLTTSGLLPLPAVTPGRKKSSSSNSNNKSSQSQSRSVSRGRRQKLYRNCIATPANLTPSATEAALYQEYTQWFYAQYKRLDQFLARPQKATLSFGLPRPVADRLVPTSPAPAELQPRSTFQFKANCRTLARYTRPALLAKLQATPDVYVAKVLAQWEHLRSSETSEREREGEAGIVAEQWEVATPANSPRQASQSLRQLAQTRSNLTIVSECLMRGVTSVELIASELQMTRTSTHLYKQSLYNSVLVTVLQKGLITSTPATPTDMDTPARNEPTAVAVVAATKESPSLPEATAEDAARPQPPAAAESKSSLATKARPLAEPEPELEPGQPVSSLALPCTTATANTKATASYQLAQQRRSGLVGLTPEPLYASNYHWFTEQREELCQFLALTVGKPSARFSLCLPKPQPQAGSRNSSNSSSNNSSRPTRPAGSLSLCRAEIVLVMGEAIEEYIRAYQAERDELLALGQVSPTTRLRWARNRREGGMSAGAQMSMLATKVYVCLAKGEINGPAIARQLGLGVSRAADYRRLLLNATLARLLTLGLAQAPAASQRQPSLAG